jgi:hypothetical protein
MGRLNQPSVSIGQNSERKSEFSFDGQGGAKQPELQGSHLSSLPDAAAPNYMQPCLLPDRP